MPCRRVSRLQPPGTRLPDPSWGGPDSPPGGRSRSRDDESDAGYLLSSLPHPHSPREPHGDQLSRFSVGKSPLAPLSVTGCRSATPDQGEGARHLACLGERAFRGEKEAPRPTRGPLSRQKLRVRARERPVKGSPGLTGSARCTRTGQTGLILPTYTGEQDRAKYLGAPLGPGVELE